MSKDINLTGVLDKIHTDIDGGTLHAGDILDTLEHRGYGPLLLGASLMTVLPTGAIPGMPTFTAIIILFLSIQLLMGRTHPWVPQKLRSFSIRKKKFDEAREKMEPVTRWLDQFIKPRFIKLTGKKASRLVAVICVVLALTMPPLEFVPFAAGVPALAVAFFGVGLSARDGLLTLIGFLITGAGAAALLYWLVF